MTEGVTGALEDARIALEEHFEAGRLTAEEYAARSEKIHDGDVEAAFADLPEPHAGYEVAPLSRTGERLELAGTAAMVFGFPLLGILSFVLNSWIPVTIAAVVLILCWGLSGQVNRSAARAILERPFDRSVQGSSARIRLSDADRRKAVELLQHHRDLGRLNLVDYEDRMTRAVTLVDREDLHELFEDIPPPWPDMKDLVPPAVAKARLAKNVKKWGSTYLDGTLNSLVLVGLPMAITYTIEGGPWWTIVLDLVAVVCGLGIRAKLNPL